MQQNTSLTPRQIVAELDRYIIGQSNAKKAVAIALRNRWRRKQVDENLKNEIVPKNILIIGPTGVGKTEIARRLAKLANAPFIKVEATKFTEVGYVGRDVDSIIRDLIDNAIFLRRQDYKNQVITVAKVNTEERILDALVGKTATEETREKFKKQLLEGKLDEKVIEIDLLDNGNSAFSGIDIPGMPSAQMGVINLSDMINKAIGNNKTKRKKLKISECYKIILDEESDKLIDEDKIIKEAIAITENEGIVFIDEIDKISNRSDVKGGEVSREGVQRDLLPLIEGTIVTTKYGSIRTDHILFIASGAFHLSKPSDLLPELQGRLPIRVELKSLEKDDMIRILKEPEASLIKQYTALLQTEGVNLIFTEEAICKIATLATEINRNVENIGARRLHILVEKLLEEISFEANDMNNVTVNIDEAYVDKYLTDITKQTDLSKFIL